MKTYGSCVMSSSAERPKWACDTSVAIAALDPSNPAHGVCREAVTDKRPVLAGHAAFESYSILTRMPLPFRLHPDDAFQALSAAFPGSCWPAPEDATKLLARLPALGISGGGTYDALVAEAARAGGLRLMTIDRRAERTYRALGVDYWLVE